MEINGSRPEPISPSTTRPPKQRRLSKKKEKMPVIQTEEDRAEWERHIEDMDVLRTELVGLATHERPQNKGKDVEGDVEMEGAEETPKEMEDGRIYLFQFPPVLPKLFDETTNANPNIKDDDVEIMDSTDLTKDPKVEIKTEEKVVEIKQEELDADEEAKRKQREEALVIEEGSIGRLVIRESGQVELVWGGTNMKVNRGMETSFFSTGAVVDGMDQWIKDEKDKDVQVMPGSRGVSHAMGGIMGKFVVTPDWTNIH
jgi:DNA-directed RNA polymerase III subunit RPC4